MEELKKNTGKPKRDMDGQNWSGLNLKSVGPTFIQFISVYIKMSFTRLENPSQMLCGRDFANERLLLCQFDVYSL